MARAETKAFTVLLDPQVAEDFDALLGERLKGRLVRRLIKEWMEAERAALSRANAGGAV